MMKNFIFLITIILITGCSYEKGGPCEYQKINGIATIVINDENTTTATFQPDNYTIGNPSFEADDFFYLHQHVRGKKGSRYPATMSFITEGTCAPFDLEITGDMILNNQIGKKSKLLWDDNNDTKKIFHAEALTYCENLHSKGYDDWRIPKQGEFNSLYRPGYKNDGLYWTNEDINLNSYPRSIRCVRDME